MTWSIADKSWENCQTGDKFEIERSLYSNFSNTVSVGSVDFATNKTSYEFTDPTSNENLNGTVYYRIRRTKQPAWGWNWAQTCQIEKEMSHQVIDELKADDITE